jgi:GH24 family phage-related lysozyme (muramidase)
VLVPKKAKRKARWTKLTPKHLSKMIGQHESYGHIHYAQQATQNLLGYQFSKHIEAVETLLQDKIGWETVNANQYAAIVSHVYVPIFLREHFNMALDVKRITQILFDLGIDNFLVLKAIKLLNDPDVTAAVKKLKPLNERKQPKKKTNTKS